MVDSYEKLSTDIEKVKQIPIVSTMLEVICRSTGMGFAAIARVTEDRWIACSVRDEIGFGLEAGSELQIGTTICNEIRQSHKAVIIDEVSKDQLYCNHHTPLMYGFQSYISFPIILKSGEFFGTLCSIDPKPAVLNNTKTIGMFKLFAELIAFHLESMDLIEQSNFVVQDLNRKLTDTIDENRQYKFISDHNLQEPLRKIRFFSSMLVSASEKSDMEKSRDLAHKVNSSAQRLSMMIKDISEFSSLQYDHTSFEQIDLNKIVSDAAAQLSQQVTAKDASIAIDDLPSIQAIPLHMEQLFFHLISNALKFSKHDVAPVIRIYARELSRQQSNTVLPTENQTQYCEILIEDNGIGIEKSQLEKIFDIFTRLNDEPAMEGFGFGLAYCRKIIRIHEGIITATSEPGKGTTFSIILPATRSAQGS